MKAKGRPAVEAGRPESFLRIRANRDECRPKVTYEGEHTKATSLSTRNRSGLSRGAYNAGRHTKTLNVLLWPQLPGRGTVQSPGGALRDNCLKGWGQE
jgi:hypothetical protein